MNQADFDRAFPRTPDCVKTAIELGIRKGKNKMKFRNKIITMGSIAAVFAVVIAAALAMGIERPPQPDVLAQPPLNASALAGPETAGMLAQPEQEVFTVYVTEKGVYYHLDEHCSGMENASAMTEAEAMQLSKKPCPVCIPLSCSGHDREEIEFVYYSQGGVYFHKTEECTGGVFALKGDYFDVTKEFPEKEPCKVCFPEGIDVCMHGRAFMAENEEAETSPMPVGKPEEETEIIKLPVAEEYVPLASGKAAEQAGSSASSANKSYIYDVFYTQSGTYYHSDEHCQGMMNAQAHIREDARRDRKSPCPICLNVYCTESGTYYHLLPDCIGMMGAKLRSLEEAYALNKTRCPVCLSPETVYCTPKGAYFHAEQYCSGMEGASPTDPEDAWNMDKDPCPVCITEGNLDAIDNSIPRSDHHQLFVKAFGKSINDLIPGYSYNYTAVQDDPAMGHALVWKMKNDADPSEELIPGCWLYGKDEKYDCYRLLVTLSDTASGHHRNTLDAFMDGTMCTIRRSSFPIESICNYDVVCGYNKDEAGFKDAGKGYSISGVMVYFDRENEVCGYDVRFVRDRKETCILRFTVMESGALDGHLIEGEAWI